MRASPRPISGPSDCPGSVSAAPRPRGELQSPPSRHRFRDPLAGFRTFPIGFRPRPRRFQEPPRAGAAWVLGSVQVPGGLGYAVLANLGNRWENSRASALVKRDPECPGQGRNSEIISVWFVMISMFLETSIILFSVNKYSFYVLTLCIGQTLLEHPL